MGTDKSFKTNTAIFHKKKNICQFWFRGNIKKHVLRTCVFPFHCPCLNAKLHSVNDPSYSLTALTHIPRLNRIALRIYIKLNQPFRPIHYTWRMIPLGSHRTLHRNAHFDSHESHCDGRKPFSESVPLLLWNSSVVLCSSSPLSHVKWPQWKVQ